MSFASLSEYTVNVPYILSKNSVPKRNMALDIIKRLKHALFRQGQYQILVQRYSEKINLDFFVLTAVIAFVVIAVFCVFTAFLVCTFKVVAISIDRHCNI